MLDEEYDSAARITLEQDCQTAPFAITCGVYGWLVHTRFFRGRPEAEEAFRDMKTALVEIVALGSVGDGEKETDVAQRVTEALDTFVERYP